MLKSGDNPEMQATVTPALACAASSPGDSWSLRSILRAGPTWTHLSVD